MEAILRPGITGNMDTDGPAVSIIMPFNDRASTPDELLHRLQKAMDKIGDELSVGYPNAVAGAVMARLGRVIANLGPDPKGKAVAIFVSPTCQKVLFVHTPVKEKMVINRSFKVRELVHDIKAVSKYLVLLTEGNTYKIYKGSTPQFLKVVALVKEYPKNQQVVATDPPQLNDMPIDAFLEQVDCEISRLLAFERLPVFVLSTKKTLGHFKKITKNSVGIVAYISGNYDGADFSKLQELLRPYALPWKSDKQSTLLELLDQAADQQKLAIGLTQVWHAALHKRGLRLVVENDFSCPVQLSVATTQHNVVEDDVKERPSLPDAIDDIITNVISGGGDVDFADHDALNKYERIALVTY